MKQKVFFRFAFVLLLVALIVTALAPAALAQGPVTPAPPALPTLDQLLAMTLRALGGLIFTALAAYAWGYLVSALAARVPPEWKVPSQVYDLLILIPTVAVAAAWNAFAGYIDVAFPGVLDQTVGAALLWIANAVFALLFARRGGVAQVVDLQRVGAARSGVLLVR